MAETVIMSGPTVNGAGAGVGPFTGPATLQVKGSSLFGNAVVRLQFNLDADTPADYSNLSKIGNLSVDSNGTALDFAADAVWWARPIVYAASADSAIEMAVSQ